MCLILAGITSVSFFLLYDNRDNGVYTKTTQTIITSIAIAVSALKLLFEITTSIVNHVDISNGATAQ